MITLKLRQALDAPLDMAAVIPERFGSCTLAEIKRISLPYGSAFVALDDLFKISGKPDDHLALEGITLQCLNLGQRMRSGRLTIIGDCGDFAGAGMRGGTLTIQGSARDYLGAGMRGGVIALNGSAGDFAGSCLPGATSGMRGGSLFISKHLGARAADRMRRGLIVCAGNAGDACASQLIAGTVVVLGTVGADAASGMRRGSLLARVPPSPMPPGFVAAGDFELSFLTVLASYITATDAALGARMRAFKRVTRWVGDRDCGGLGEFLTPSAR